MLQAAWEILLDIDDDGSYAADISAYMRSMAWRIGRDSASFLNGRCTASWFSIQLLNFDGRFNQGYPSGAYYGKLKTGLHIKLTGSYGGSSYVKFVGKLDEIVPELEISGHHLASMTALGAMAIVVNAEDAISVEMQPAIKTGGSIIKILEALGFTASDYEVADGETQLEWWFLDGRAIDSIRDLENAEFGLFGDTEEGKLFFRDRNFLYTNSRSVSSQATFSDSASATLRYQSLSPVSTQEDIANVAVASVTAKSLGAESVLWELGERPAIQPSQTLRFIAEYADGVYPWTTPASGVDYSVNTLEDGSGTDITSSMTVSVTKYANRMLISITNGAVSMGYISLQARGIPVLASDPALVQSPAVIPSHPRRFPIETSLLPNTKIAQGYCDFVVSKFATAPQLFEMTFLATRDANHLTEALARKPQDRITLVANNNMKMGVSADYWVEYIEYSHSSDGFLVTYGLSPADVLGSAWILGTSVLGTGTVLLDRW